MLQHSDSSATQSFIQNLKKLNDWVFRAGTMRCLGQIAMFAVVIGTIPLWGIPLWAFRWGY